MSTTKILALEGINDEALCRMIEDLLTTMQGIQSAQINSFSQTLTLEISSNDVAGTVSKVVNMLKNVDSNITITKTGVGTAARPHAQPRGLYQGVNPYGISDDDDDDDDDYIDDGPLNLRRDDDDDDDDEEEYDIEREEKKQKPRKVKKEKPPKLPKPPKVRKPLPLSESLLSGLMGLGGSIIILAVAFALPNGIAAYILSLIAYLVAAVFALLAVTGKDGQKDMAPEVITTLVAAAIGFALRYYRGAGGAMILCLVGLLCMNYAKARFQIVNRSLGDIHPKFVTRDSEGTIEQVLLDDVFVGDHVVINTGDTIPFDGEVLTGTTQIDAALLRGREDIKQVNIGDIVLCGYLNLGGAITIEVKRQMEESDAYTMISKIQEGDPHTMLGNLAEKVAANFFIGSLGLGVVLMFLSLFNISGSGEEMVKNSMLMIALAGSCGMVASVAMAFSYGIFGAFEHHILVEGGRSVEVIANAQSVAMGLVGTLTKGVYKITDILAEGYTESEVLEFAAYAESKSEHPLARTIVEKYRDFSGEEIDPERLSICETVRGGGVRAMVDRSMVLAGSARLMNEASVELPQIETKNMVVYVSVRGEYAGAILMEDTVKHGALELADELRAQRVEKVAILTSSDAQFANPLAVEMQVDEAYSELSGKEKLDQVQKLLETPNHKLLFVGTAEEDESFLAMADIGVGLGHGLLASRFVSLLLPSGELSKLTGAIKFCKSIQGVARQNLILFSVAKTLLLLLSLMGKATLFGVVACDTSILIVMLLNAFRAMYCSSSPTE